MILLSDRYHEGPEILSPGQKEFERLRKKLLKVKHSRVMKNETKLKGKIKTELLKASNNKCAYCESKVNATAKFEIEHHRPSNRISDDPKSSVGYYWLACEWTNLLPSCPACNQSKRSLFPIHPNGKRAEVPLKNGNLVDEECHYRKSKSLDAEKALLIHPGFGEPDSHFAFLRNGKIFGLEGRGEKTIDVCDLNRELLVLARKRIIDDLVAEVKKLHAEVSPDDNGNYLERFERVFFILIELQDPKASHSLLGRYLFDNFEYFVIDSLRFRQCREKARNTFEHYCKIFQ